MKRTALLAALLCFVLGLALATASEAQQNPPDLGEPAVLVAACDAARSIGEAEGLAIRNCRRLTEDIVTGNSAIVHIRLATNVGPFELQVFLTKSLWHVNTIK